MPDAQNYAGGVCASGGLKILVPDAAQHGLIAHYTFDDNRAADSSGHGNHAKVVPNAGPGHGATGAGAWFDGVKSMEVPHIPTMESPDLTVSFWLYLLEDSTNSYRTLVRKAKSVTDMTPAIMLLPNDRRLHIRLSTTASAQSASQVVGFDSTALIPLRRWTHVAYVLKGGAALSLYVNGVKDCPMIGNRRRGASCPPGGASFAWDEGDVRHNSGPLYVGADPFMSGANMFLDSLKIFNIALPEKDVIAEANTALGLLGNRFLRLGCQNCTAGDLRATCAELDEYHPCLCQVRGGRSSARGHHRAAAQPPPRDARDRRPSPHSRMFDLMFCAALSWWSQELMSGGLNSARAMGWLRGPSASWRFHAEVQNAAACDLAGAMDGGPAGRPGFCCHD